MKIMKCSNSRNFYGEPCTKRYVILNKGNAVSEYLNILDDVTASTRPVEYTVAIAGCSPREAYEIHQEVSKVLALRVGNRLVEYSKTPLKPIA